MKSKLANKRMRVTRVNLLVVVLLVAMAVLTGSIGIAEDSLATSETTATVAFLDGELELDGKAVGSGLNFDFGQHGIPAQSVSYHAVNRVEETAVDHALQVVDTRMSSGDWFVTVELTSFAAEEAGSFDAMIELVNPVFGNANTAAGTDGLTVEEEIRIVSGNGGVLVQEADDTLARGLYTTTWTNEDVSLHISNGEVLNVGVANYNAELSWTLNLGPQ